MNREDIEPTQNVRVRVTRSEYNRLTYYARRSRVDLSDYLRACIVDVLAEEAEVHVQRRRPQGNSSGREISTVGGGTAS